MLYVHNTFEYILNQLLLQQKAVLPDSLTPLGAQPQSPRPHHLPNTCYFPLNLGCLHKTLVLRIRLQSHQVHPTVL